MKRTLLIGKDTHDLEITRQDGVITLVWNGEAQEADVVEVEPGTFSVIMGGQTYDVRIDRVRNPDPDVQGFRATLHDGAYDFGLQDPIKALLAAAGGAGGGGGILTSPMPGKIVKVLVAEGEEVAEGQTLLIMEAMKMQNELKATSAGIVGKVSVQEGATVETGSSLITITAPKE
jgi:biotin carboxyl carrier protein